MSIPQEYKLEDIVFEADNIVVRSATHPMHGRVLIYTPSDSLSPDIAVAFKRKLYQSGIQMQNALHLQDPFLTRALELSNNPNAPYIIIAYAQYTLDDLLAQNIRSKPTKAFQLCCHILNSLRAVDEAGYCPDSFKMHQIRLESLSDRKPAFIPLDIFNPEADSKPTKPFASDQSSTETITNQTPSHPTPDDDRTIAVNANQLQIQANVTKDNVPTKPKTEYVPRNIYLLGTVVYRLVFAEKYHLSDNTAADNIKKLSPKWRNILKKSLSPDIEASYQAYSSMLADIETALSRNKKITLALAPVLIASLVIAALFGYRQYNRHRIMTSEAGQAIENFLDIVNTTNSDFPPPLDHPLPTEDPNDDITLKPFDEIPLLEPED